MNAFSLNCYSHMFEFMIKEKKNSNKNIKKTFPNNKKKSIRKTHETQRLENKNTLENKLLIIKAQEHFHQWIIK